MVQHIRAIQSGSYPREIFTVILSIDGVEYIAYSVSGPDYRRYKRQVQYGEGYAALNMLRKHYTIERRDLPTEDQDELSKQIQAFLKDRGLEDN